MLDWLYGLPDTIIAACFGVTITVLFVGSPLLLQRAFGVKIDADTSETVLKGLPPVISLVAFVLGFSLVQAQINIRGANDLVATEAAQLNQLDRQLTRFGTKQVRSIRMELREYAGSIVRDDWPAMQTGKGSPATAALFKPLSRALFAIDPQNARSRIIYADILHKGDELAESRARRLDASRLALPPIFWQSIAGIVFVLIGLSACVRVNAGSLIAVAGQGLAIGLSDRARVRVRPALQGPDVGVAGADSTGDRSDEHADRLAPRRESAVWHEWIERGLQHALRDEGQGLEGSVGRLEILRFEQEHRARRVGAAPGGPHDALGVQHPHPLGFGVEQRGELLRTERFGPAARDETELHGRLFGHPQAGNLGGGRGSVPRRPSGVAMAFDSLHAFVSALRRAGELVEIDALVDPYLEITEITDRVVKAGGPALLFTNVKGSRVPGADQPIRHGSAAWRSRWAPTRWTRSRRASARRSTSRCPDRRREARKALSLAPLASAIPRTVAARALPATSSSTNPTCGRCRS